MARDTPVSPDDQIAAHSRSRLPRDWRNRAKNHYFASLRIARRLRKSNEGVDDLKTNVSVPFPTYKICIRVRPPLQHPKPALTFDEIKPLYRLLYAGRAPICHEAEFILDSLVYFSVVAVLKSSLDQEEGRKLACVCG